MDPEYWVLLGPTGVGKTGTAVHLADRVDLEIIGLDSRQIYKGLDIGTAKPSLEERAAVRHHLVDVLDPGERWDAMEYAVSARTIIHEVSNRGRVPLLVGGTGFYLAAVMGEFSEHLPPRSEAVRTALADRIKRNGIDGLWSDLKRIDPVSAGRIEPADRSRIIRALEIYELTGVAPSVLAENHPPKPWGTAKVAVLSMRTDHLKRRIRRRLEKMIRDGWLQEVSTLLASGCHGDTPAMNSLGYAELLQVVQGELALEIAVQQIYHRTWHYAKRQLTWFRRFPETAWVDAECEAVVERLLSLYRGS